MQQVSITIMFGILVFGIFGSFICTLTFAHWKGENCWHISLLCCNCNEAIYTRGDFPWQVCLWQVFTFSSLYEETFQVFKCFYRCLCSKITVPVFEQVNPWCTDKFKIVQTVVNENFLVFNRPLNTSSSFLILQGDDHGGIKEGKVNPPSIFHRSQNCEESSFFIEIGETIGKVKKEFKNTDNAYFIELIVLLITRKLHM